MNPSDSHYDHHDDSGLKTILQTIRATTPGRSLAIFDLDSTLYDLTLRVTAILDRFAADPDNQRRFPDECQKLRDVEIRRTDWGLTGPLGRIGLKKPQHEDFMNAVQDAWVRGFFSNDFLDRDFPLPGAVHFVQQCVRLGADVIYLTGRDVPRMADGTETSMKACGFPLDQTRARLHLKPEAHLDDAEFKADAIAHLAQNYEHVWFFENEPVNINLVVKRVPSVKIVFIDTCHSGLESVKDALATVKHFEVSISDLE